LSPSCARISDVVAPAPRVERVARRRKRSSATADDGRASGAVARRRAGELVEHHGACEQAGGPIAEGGDQRIEGSINTR
jgi:hypothetical protein